MHLSPVSPSLSCPDPCWVAALRDSEKQSQALTSAPEAPLKKALKGAKLQKQPVEGLYPLCNFTRGAKTPLRGSVTEGESRGDGWERLSGGCVGGVG